MLCSVVVSSFNKAEFVGVAVESALAQTHPAMEVIVVDDGSSDGSVSVLEGFGDRIQLLAKSNGGQASAMNEGFRLSRGEIVFFLDCDDTLDPDVVQRVVDAWTPETAKVHFRLRKIREDGSVIEGKFIPPYREFSTEDVGPVFRRFGLYPAPPTTGNAFARRVLEQIMPLSESIYRAWPDTPLVGAAPMFGTVYGLAGVGGSFRESAVNYSIGTIAKVESKLVCELAYLDFMRTQFGDKLPKDFALRWPMHLKDRLMIARFSHAATRESPVRLAASYVWSVVQWPEYFLKRKIALVGWGVAMAVLPTRVLKAIPKIAGPNVRL